MANTETRFDVALPDWLDAGDGLIASLDLFYARMLADEASLPEYFSPDYVQRANGAVMYYAGLVEHIRHIHRFSKETTFRVEDAIAIGGTIAERHMVEMIDGDGGRLAVETACFIRFSDRRIAEIYEVFRVADGEGAMVRFAAGA